MHGDIYLTDDREGLEAAMAQLEEYAEEIGRAIDFEPVVIHTRDPEPCYSYLIPMDPGNLEPIRERLKKFARYAAALERLEHDMRGWYKRNARRGVIPFARKVGLLAQLWRDMQAADRRDTRCRIVKLSTEQKERLK